MTSNHAVRPSRADEPGQCRLDILSTVDLSTVFRLHRKIYASLPDKTVLYPRDEAFFEQLLAGEGRVIGAWAQERLVGYTAFCRVDPALRAYGAELELPVEDHDKVAESAGSVVNPDFRRCGLYLRLFRMKCFVARRDGFRHLSAIVSLNNPASAATTLQCGFQVRALHFDQDGANLLLLSRLQHRPASAGQPVAHWVDLADVHGHREALAAGRRGVGYRWSSRALLVGYT